MLFTEHPFLDRFEPPPRPASRRWSSCFPTPSRRRHRQRSKHGLTAGAAQPAGRRLGWRRARHRLPARPRGRVPRRRRPGHRLCHRARLQAAQLPGRQGAGRVPSRRAARHLRRQPALRRQRAEGRRAEAADRADQHFDIPGFYLNTHSAGAGASSTRWAHRQPVPAVRHLPHAAHGRRTGRHDREAPAAHRPHAARRQPGPQRTGHRRDQLPLPVRHCSTASATRHIGCEYKPATTTEAGLGWISAARAAG
jgi:hydroxypyruvate isomerase